MKSIEICALLLSIAITSYGQQVDSAKQVISYSQQTDSLNLTTSKAYRIKSHNQKTVGWVLTTAGAAGFIITTLAALNDASKAGFGFFTLLGAPEPVHHSYTVPYLLSAACVAGGIVLFIAASKNKRNSNRVSLNFKMENAAALQSLTTFQKYYPCIAVKIKLNNSN